METIALNQEYDYETRKRLARYLSGIDQEFDDFADLWNEPTFGGSLMEDTREGLRSGSNNSSESKREKKVKMKEGAAA
jgi:hypothetical protein